MAPTERSTIIYMYESQSKRERLVLGRAGSIYLVQT